MSTNKIIAEGVREAVADQLGYDRRLVREGLAWNYRIVGRAVYMAIKDWLDENSYDIRLAVKDAARDAMERRDAEEGAEE